ncbi:hypothetical protein PIIN_00931 [Serendipita indica DSM 11827]|uniref:Uncharacterized protein n=1 Tax=Serendipita indica (strain DSM 11827) TaxID=1109443 RepID=G4T715_SERID|nr:hypothetical protein PIIN_00931 [Serendipita indica DSM 11827]
MDASPNGILTFHRVKLSPSPRGLMDRVFTIWELAASIEEIPPAKRQCSPSDLNLFLDFIKKPCEPKWEGVKERAIEIGQQPSIDWKSRIENAEQKDAEASKRLAKFKSVTHQAITATKIVDAVIYGSAPEPVPYHYPIPGFTSREAFIAIFLYSRKMDSLGPKGSFPHFYIEIGGPMTKLRRWNEQIKSRIYVVMSRGHFEVHWQKCPDKQDNISVNGRIIFTRKEITEPHRRDTILVYLKDLNGNLITIPSPPSVQAILRDDPKQKSQRNFVSLRKAIEAIWSEIDGSWDLRDHTQQDEHERSNSSRVGEDTDIDDTNVTDSNPALTPGPTQHFGPEVRAPTPTSVTQTLTEQLTNESLEPSAETGFVYREPDKWWHKIFTRK